MPSIKDKPPALAPVLRFRLRLSKGPAAGRLSHLDQVRELRTSLRATGLPLAMSSARRSLPRVSFGPALASGQESRCEYLDLELTERSPLGEAIRRLEAALPAGYRVLEGRRIPLHYPSVESLASLAVYELHGKLPEAPLAPREPILKAAAGPGLLRLELRIGAGAASRPELLVRSWPGWEGFEPSTVVREELWAVAPAGERLTP
jgi:hypothetical protein